MFRRFLSTRSPRVQDPALQRRLFPDPFAHDHLSGRTWIALVTDPSAPQHQLRLSGWHSRTMFNAWAGNSPTQTESSEPRMALGRDVEGSLLVWTPAALSLTGKQTVDIYLPPQMDHDSAQSVLERIQQHWSTQVPCAVVDPSLFFRSAFEQKKLRAMDFPTCQQIISLPTEQKRQEALRAISMGNALVYQCWREQLEECDRLLKQSLSFPEVQPLVKQWTSARLQRLRQQVEQHVGGRVRAPLLRKGIHVTLYGPPKVGKTTLMNLLLQKDASSETIASERINVDGIPLVLNDNVHEQGADWKLLVLDLPHVYAHTSPEACIPKDLLHSIDDRTMVLLNQRDRVSIRVPAPPAKMRYKNTPLGPQGEVKRTAFRGRVPLRTDGSTEGNSILYGHYGLRVLSDVRLTERCLQECRSTLHRHLKDVKGARFWLRVLPTHPMSKKPLGVRMGKGKGAFDHWEAKVSNRQLVMEVGGSVREDVARQALKAVAARLPGRTEFVTAPVEEQLTQVEDRIRAYAAVPPLGVWTLSAKTGEGVDAWLKDMVPLLKRAYCQDTLVDDPSVEPQSVWARAMNRLSEQLKESTAEPTSEGMSSLLQEVDRLQVQEASEGERIQYLYHSTCGVLQQNRLQQEILCQLERREKKQDSLPVMSVEKKATVAFN